MNLDPRCRLTRWLPVALVVLMLMLIDVPDAAAQSRARGRSSSSSEGRTERAERSNSSRSSREKATPQKRESTSRARTPANSRTRSNTRTQRSTPAQPQSRSRTSRSQERTQNQRTETRQRQQATPPSRSRTQSSRESRTQTPSRGRTQTSRQSRATERAQEAPSRSRTQTRSGTQSRTQTRSTQPSRQNRSRATGRTQEAPNRTRSTGRTRQTPSSRSGQVERGRTNSRSSQRSPQTERGRTETRASQPGRTARNRQVDRSGTVERNRSADRSRTVDRGRTRVEAPTSSTRVAIRSGRRVEGRVKRHQHRDVRRGNVYYHDRDRNVRYLARDHWHDYFRYGGRYHRKHWKRHRNVHLHFPVVVRPRIHVDIYWPWVHRHRHGWRPRYQYRQVVYVDAGWGSGYRQRRHTQVDVRTTYYHELRRADGDRAEVDIYVERIELYENGRYLGTLDYIPEQLGRIRATVYRDGYAEFDRDVFILGDSRTGFELISTPYYDGFVLDQYRPAHGLRVGTVDLRRGRVVPASYSYLFDPYDFNGYVPVSLVPENADWLFDYGEGSFSGAYYDYDPYYYGGYSGFDDEYDNGYYEGDYYEEDYYEDDYGQPHFSVRSTVAEANFAVEPLSQTYDRTYTTQAGARIQLKRETQFVRVK